MASDEANQIETEVGERSVATVQDEHGVNTSRELFRVRREPKTDSTAERFEQAIGEIKAFRLQHSLHGLRIQELIEEGRR